MSSNKKAEGTLFHQQPACAALWKALGLAFRQELLQQSLEVKNGAAAEKPMPLDYDVFIGYHPQRDISSDCESNNGRQHVRYQIDDSCQVRFDSVLGYGQGVLHNISVSGAAIGVYRKLTMDQAIVMMVNSPDPQKRPIAVRLTVVRDAGATDDGLHSYGCRIDRVSDPNG